MTIYQQLAKERFRLFMHVTDNLDEHIASQQFSAEISRAFYYADIFWYHRVIDNLHNCPHGLQHCPVCGDEQQWPSRATRGDLIP